MDAARKSKSRKRAGRVIAFLMLAAYVPIHFAWVFSVNSHRYVAPSHSPPFSGRETSVELSDAAAKGDLAKVKALLYAGISPDAGDPNRDEGRSALEFASENGQTEVVRYLLDRGADINARGEWGENALTAAAYGGQVDTVHLLIDRGADVNADDDGSDALDYLLFKHGENYNEIASMIGHAGGMYDFMGRYFW